MSPNSRLEWFNQYTYLAGFTLLSSFKIARGSECDGQESGKDGNDAHIEQESSLKI
jgi:hypothetical protein